MTHGEQNLLIFREHNQALLRHQLIAHPDGELSPIAFDQLRPNSQLALDQLRHTGGSRTERGSNFAKADANMLHRFDSFMDDELTLTYIDGRTPLPTA